MRRYSAALDGVAWALGLCIQSAAIAGALQISELWVMRSVKGGGFNYRSFRADKDPNKVPNKDQTNRLPYFVWIFVLNFVRR